MYKTRLYSLIEWRVFGLVSWTSKIVKLVGYGCLCKNKIRTVKLLNVTTYLISLNLHLMNFSQPSYMPLLKMIFIRILLK